jgi:hypothetical protein
VRSSTLLLTRSVSVPRALLPACLVVLLAGCALSEDDEVARTTSTIAPQPTREEPVSLSPAATLLTGTPIGSISASGTKVAVAFEGDDGPSCSPFLLWDARADAHRPIPSDLECEDDRPVFLEIELTRSSLFASSAYAPAFSAETAWGSVRLHRLDGGASIEVESAFSTGEEGGTAIGDLAADASADVGAFTVWRYPPASYDATFDGIVVGSRDGTRRYTQQQLAGTVIAVDGTGLLLRRDGGELAWVDTAGGAPREVGRFRGPVVSAAGRVAALRKGVLHVLETRTGKLVARKRVGGAAKAGLLAFDGRLVLYTRTSTVRLLDVATRRDLRTRLPDGAETMAELTSAGLFFVLDGDRVAFVPRGRLLRAFAGSSPYPPPALVNAAR